MSEVVVVEKEKEEERDKGKGRGKQEGFLQYMCCTICNMECKCFSLSAGAGTSAQAQWRNSVSYHITAINVVGNNFRLYALVVSVKHDILYCGGFIVLSTVTCRDSVQLLSSMLAP